MDENKNTIIIAVCALCLFMTLIIACTRGCKTTNSTKPTKIINTPTKITKKDNLEKTNKKNNNSSYSSNFSSNSGGSGAQPPLYTEEELKIIEKKLKEQKERIIKLKEESIKKMLEDPNLDPKAKEQLKIRSHPSFFKAKKAFKEKDYNTAIKGFSEVLKDESASPLTVYFACINLMEIAQDTNDFELYFIAARVRAKLIATKDLSIIDREQSDDELKEVNYIEKLLKSRNDKKYFDICVQEKLSTYERRTDNSEARAIKEVQEDLNYYSEIYKELLK